MSWLPLTSKWLIDGHGRSPSVRSGGLAQSSLLLAGLFVYWVKATTKVIGALAGYGAGALIAAVAFNLVPEAEELNQWELAVWMLVGALVFVVADRIVESRFGEGDDAGPLGIVVGSVVDVVPESIIFGIQIGTGQVIGAAFVGAVFISNIPQALAPSAALAESGWARRRRQECGASWCCLVPSQRGSATSLGTASVPPAHAPPVSPQEGCSRC